MSKTVQQSLFNVELQCSNCGYDMNNWHTTPQGRKYCPNCNQIKSNEQRNKWNRKMGELP